MPDWQKTVVFLSIALALFVSFVTTSDGDGMTRKLLALGVVAFIYFQWGR